MVVNESQIRLYETNIGMIIVCAQRPSREQILKHGGALDGSYAADLIKRLYHFIVGRAIDLKKEYQDYYESEYSDIKAFLYHRYCLSGKWLERLAIAIEGDGFVGLVPSTWGRDWQIDSLIEYDDEFDVVAKALHAEWVENDDED